MPRVEFSRNSLEVRIAAAESGRIAISLAGQEKPDVIAMQQDAVCAWVSDRVPSQPPTDVHALPPVLSRLTLDIRSPELHAEAWEQWMQTGARKRNIQSIVRATRVTPRVSQIKFSPPLRLLVCDAKDAPDLLNAIRNVFGPRWDAEVAGAYVGAAGELEKVDRFDALPFGWPLVDILHLCRLRPNATEQEQLSPSAEDWGSVGWLTRLLDAWQTRLLLLEFSSETQARMMRRVGAAIVARGGPGVIVCRESSQLSRLYAEIIHDMPLDALGLAVAHEPPLAGVVDCVFGGAGREDLARVSGTAQGLIDLHEAMERNLPQAPAAFSGAGAGRGLTGFERRLAVEPNIRGEISRAALEASKWDFSIREGDGLLPMSAALERLRAQAMPFIGKLAEETFEKPARYVNGSLYREGAAARRRVNPELDRLVLGQPYQFVLRIGARDPTIPTYQTSLFSEIPKAPAGGVWVEVAVNGVGFEIEGDPVQELWVPEQGQTDDISFAVRPTRSGAAVLRYTFYYRQNVLQSFRLAALVVPTGSKRAPVTSEETSLLAAALHASAEQLPLTTYVNRLEYAAATLGEAAQMPHRRLSIVANDVAGQRVITVKGQRYFFDSKPGNADSFAGLLRQELFDASVKKLGNDRDKWPYRFGEDVQLNEDNLREVLPRLALWGWRLYDDAFARKCRNRFEPDLQGADASITIAQALLEEVIPWAAMYDRECADPTAGEGPVEVCTAALPEADGTLRFSECRRAPQCLLNHGASERNVACPLRFWGFRHFIEIPPKQVEDDREEESLANRPAPSAQAMSAGSHRPLQLTALINEDLSGAEAHARALKALTTLRGKPVQWKCVEMKPEEVIKAAGQEDLDVLYFFCHARGAPEVRPPVVEFSAGGKPVRFSSDRFQAVWKYSPLIILNGCSTAAFTPDALSPFIRKFTRDGEAGGVMGTEIPVHQDLAAEVGCQMLERVLDGEPVGTALLAVRRVLLAQRNPLGLAYTLFAFSDLTVGTDKALP